MITLLSFLFFLFLALLCCYLKILKSILIFTQLRYIKIYLYGRGYCWTCNSSSCLVISCSPSFKHFQFRCYHKSHHFLSAQLKCLSLLLQCTILLKQLHRCPLAVHELLDLKMIQGQAKRKRYFYEDETHLDPKFAVSNDFYDKINTYNILKYVRAQMAQPDNYNSDQSKKDSTFNYANTIPQK